MTVRQAVSTWDESLRDPEPFWSVVRPISITFVASFASGLLVVLVLNAPLLMPSSQGTVQEVRQPEAERRVEATSAAGLLGPAPTVRTPAATPVAIRTPPSGATTPAAAPSVDAAWQAMLPSLDGAWGTDTPATLVLLKAFHARFPEFQPARDKLYAAVLATAQDLAQAGESADAEGQLTDAIALLPEREEAGALLLAIAATPAPASDTAQLDDEPAASDTAQLNEEQPASDAGQLEEEPAASDTAQLDEEPAASDTAQLDQQPL